MKDTSNERDLRRRMRPLEQFVHESSVVRDTEVLQKRWKEFLNPFGSDGYRIVPVSAQVMEQPKSLRDIAHNTPSGWLDRYREQGFHRHDPVLAKELVDRGPFTWVEAATEHRGPEAERVLAESREFGVSGGISLSLWLEPMRLIAVGLYIPSNDIFLDNTTKRMLRTASFVFCARYREMAAIANFAGEPPPALGPRERDVLRWIALGKTKQEIADLLCVSISCVKRHCENAYLKLG